MLLAQGTPCILAGDEFGNTQKGNNNVYCQDNPVGWLDWSGLEKHPELHDFVKELIAFRKKHPVFWPEKEMTGMTYSKKGVPDVSYHGENAWRVPLEVSSRQLGVYYSGTDRTGEGDEDCFVAYNMHWLEHTLHSRHCQGKEVVPDCIDAGRVLDKAELWMIRNLQK